MKNLVSEQNFNLEKSVIQILFIAFFKTLISEVIKTSIIYFNKYFLAFFFIQFIYYIFHIFLFQINYVIHIIHIYKIRIDFFIFVKKVYS